MLWLNWAGPPEDIILDPDPRFLGVFQTKCERLNIVQRDLIIPVDHNMLAELSKILDQVVGERIIIVDHE